MRLLLLTLALAAAQETSEDYKELLDRVALLEERLRLTNIPGVATDENDERSLLEQFTDAAGDFIVNRLLPRSDAQCAWNYAKSICVPRCECAFRHRAGDLTPSRACRLRDVMTTTEVCDPDVSGERGTFEKVAQHVVVRSERLVDKFMGFLRDAGPPTDDACDWRWASRRCEPASTCQLRFRFGDFHAGRSCRLRPPAPPVDDGFGDLDADFGRLDEGPAPDGGAEGPAPASPIAGAPEGSEAPDAAEGGGEEDPPADAIPAPTIHHAAPYGIGDDDRDATW